MGNIMRTLQKLKINKGDIKMNFNEFAKEVHENSIEKGWWEDERSFAEIIALCHSELSEALDEYRNGRPMFYYNCEEDMENVHPCNPKDEIECLNFGVEEICKYRNKKPEGIATELADCIIRMLDYCGKENIDIKEIIKIKHEYNKTRPYKHGGKVI